MSGTELLATFCGLSRDGPAFWADFSDRCSVVGSLRPLPIIHASGWASAARRPPPMGGRPWMSGIVGWFGYEAGNLFERMPPGVGPRLLPDAWWGEIAAAAAFAPDGRLLESRGSLPRAPAPPGSRHRAVLRSVETPPDSVFIGGVQRVLEHLRAGDAYQVNLSRRTVVRGAIDPLGTWLRLRASNPSRRGIFLDLGNEAVICNSPELLLRVRGERVLSVPIKGTAPLGTPRRALLQSEKERAELTMIVDLVRSDLGRVSAPGSVVAGPRRVGRVGHVWHAMQRVTGTLAPGRDAIDAFSALFPAGSVTGAPKVRAMEIIAALEPAPRGLYCGSLGWFGPGGADVNVAIRTISVCGDEAHVQAGSGLVIGSDPRAELAEAKLKAERMLEAL